MPSCKPPYLAYWKQQKQVFETVTNKKKPSEKFLGVFNKSSGIESALKTIDSALAKRNADEAIKGREAFNKAREAYYKLLLAASKTESADRAETEIYAKACGKLNQAMVDIYASAEDEIDKLESDPRTPMTVANAVGPKVVQSLRQSKILANGDLQGWLKSAAADGIEVGGKMIKDPESAEAKKGALRKVNELKDVFARFNSLLSKEMERAKGLDAAQKFFDEYIDAVEPTAGGFKSFIGEWTHAQQNAFERHTPTKAAAKAAFEAWQAKSAAWKFITKLEPAFQQENIFIDEFNHELRLRK
jgi:hypothetical protein